MAVGIRPFCDDDTEAVVQLSLLAWAPIFRSFEHVLGKTIYSLIYPDWTTSQREAVEKVCKDRERFCILVGEWDGVVVGFLAYELNRQSRVGEVELLAVHPDYQNRGIGTQLNAVALDEMKAHGMQLAVVGTGGDPAHAPARRSYEKAGYTPLPLVRYYKDL